MKKQTIIYLDETDKNKMEVIKEKYGIESTSEMFRVLISTEYFHVRQLKN